MSTSEEFSPDYVEGYRDGMDRAAEIVNGMRHTNPPVTKDVDRYLHTAARALKHGAETALAVGTAQHALAPLPTPVLGDAVRVTSPYCDHLGVGMLTDMRLDARDDDGIVVYQPDKITAVVRYPSGAPWIGPMSAVVPA